MKNEKKWLVDTCNESKYYVKFENALHEFWRNPKAHTLAQKINGIWYPKSEKLFTKQKHIL